jgi:hypothetical protein
MLARLGMLAILLVWGPFSKSHLSAADMSAIGAHPAYMQLPPEYQADGKTPLGIAAEDVVRFKLREQNSGALRLDLSSLGSAASRVVRGPNDESLGSLKFFVLYLPNFPRDSLQIAGVLVANLADEASPGIATHPLGKSGLIVVGCKLRIGCIKFGLAGFFLLFVQMRPDMELARKLALRRSSC